MNSEKIEIVNDILETIFESYEKLGVVVVDGEGATVGMEEIVA